MASDNLPSTVPVQRDTEAERQRRLAEGADAQYAADPDRAKRLHEATLRALADADAGRVVDDDVVQAWLESIGTDHELPPPKSG